MEKEISKEIGKFSRKFVSYQKWKKRTISLFSEVHDKETLARILRSRKKVAESSAKLVDAIFISGGVGVAINFITEDNLLAFMHMDAIQILIAIACIFGLITVTVHITGILMSVWQFLTVCVKVTPSRK